MSSVYDDHLALKSRLAGILQNCTKAGRTSVKQYTGYTVMSFCTFVVTQMW